MKKNHHELYKLAKYYDIAFGFRDFPAECDFLTQLARRHLGRQPATFIELAAGPARHALEFAGRDVWATALDSANHMVDYALKSADAKGIAVEGVCADMTDFSLSRSYDLAALLMDSAAYLLDNKAVLQHLNCVADHLTKRGIYVMEMSHPRDVFKAGKSTSTKWEMERDGTKVSIEWGTDSDPFDPILQITDVTVTLRYQGPDGSGTVTDHAPQRCFTANEFEALVRASGRFRLVEVFGSMQGAVPFTNDKTAWRMVPVLQKVR